MGILEREESGGRMANMGWIAIYSGVLSLFQLLSCCEFGIGCSGLLNEFGVVS